MHRQNPLQQGYVGYTGGGVRALVDAVNDLTGMQEMKGSFLAGENRQKIESPQNYGFTSVVLPATKDAMGMIEACAEAYISFLGGNRSFPVAGVMDDRRHRPWGLKPGENAQYDDIGQMTLMRRLGLFMLSLDGKDEKTGEKIERSVSMRHVVKKKQKRPGTKTAATPSSSGGSAPASRTGEGIGGGEGGVGEGGDGPDSGPDDPSGKDFPHEGEEVNTEIRATSSKVEFRTGDDVVGHYDKESKTWLHTSGGDEEKSTKVTDTHVHMRFKDKTVWVDEDGIWSSEPIQLKVDPESRAVLKDPMLERIERLEARVRELEARL